MCVMCVYIYYESELYMYVQVLKETEPVMKTSLNGDSNPLHSGKSEHTHTHTHTHTLTHSHRPQVPTGLGRTRSTLSMSLRGAPGSGNSGIWLVS